MDFSLPQLSTNQTWQLSKEAAGRAVMLTFWTSWCPDSERDLAAKMPLAAHADRSKLQFVTVNVTGREGDVDLQAYLQKRGWDFLVLQDRGTALYDHFKCKGVPTTVLLNNRHEQTAQFGESAKLPDILAELTSLID